MTKSDVRSFRDLVEYAGERAIRSRRRKDPVAWAYWRESARWAGSAEVLLVAPTREGFSRAARCYAESAAALAREGRHMDAALSYSRAKWMVIIGRNLGFVMGPKETGVSPSWMDRETPEAA